MRSRAAAAAASLVGFLDTFRSTASDARQAATRSARPRRRRTDLADAVPGSAALSVLLDFSSSPTIAVVVRVRECEQLGVGVARPRLYETVYERATLGHVGGLPLLTLRPADPVGWQFAIKHSLDRASRCSRWRRATGLASDRDRRSFELTGSDYFANAESDGTGGNSTS